MRSRTSLRAIASAGTIVAALTLAACGGSSGSSAATTASPPPTTTATSSTTSKPNIVFVLTDDLSMNLLRYMPQVQAMQAQGVSYDNYFVTDSLCCPSRSSIYTGEFPHDTGVFTNTGSDGGIRAFYAHGDQNAGFNVALQKAGYTTGMMGKYLNGYMSPQSPVSDTYVPPGWNEWDVTGPGYKEFDYPLNENGTIHRYGHSAEDYLVDVMAHKGASFVRSSARAQKPFFLELATFAPHGPYTPAPRYKHSFPGLQAPRPASYDRLPTAAPSWLSGRPTLTAAQETKIDHAFGKRVQAVQGVDDMITTIQNALRSSHQLQNTYIVFSSDNGYHMGEYRLLPGKQTAFDTDINVPLVIDGPGVPHGVTSTAMAQNTDLAPTFEQLAGTSAPCDGHSLTTTFRGPTPADWRDAVLVEHHRPDRRAGADPDAQQKANGFPTTYEAMRTAGFAYVEYADGEHEYYDLRSDPHELHNRYGSLPASQRARMHSQLAKMRACHGKRSCWAAQHVTGA